MAARQWTQQLGQMLTLAGIFGGIAGAGGAVLSGLQQGLPTGPLIIVAASAIVLVSIALAPQRGLLWRAWQNRRDRRRFAAQQVLQDIHRHALQHGDSHYPAPGGMLVALRGPVVRRALRQLQGEGLLQESAADAWSLSQTGRQRAQAAAQNQRLWERYRQYGEELGLPAVDEDLQRRIDELLPASAIERLEMLPEAQD